MENNNNDIVIEESMDFNNSEFMDDTQDSSKSDIDFKNVKIKLLKGVFYKSDNKNLWRVLENNINSFRDFFIQIGLEVAFVSDEYAYLKQEEIDEDSDQNKLIHKKKFTYQQSLIIILLREFIHNYEDVDIGFKGYFINFEEIYDKFKDYLEKTYDEVKSLEKVTKKCIDELISANLLVEVDKKSGGSNFRRKYEIKKVIEEKITLDEIREFKERLENE